MVHIEALKVLEHPKIFFHFSDGTSKIIDFSSLLGNDTLTSALKDPAFFSQVQLLENGRGIFWPNDYDLCPDFLRYHFEDEAKNTSAA